MDCPMEKTVIEYTFSEFLTPSCMRAKVVWWLQCKSYKFGPLIMWGTTCNLISHVCLFLITRPLIHHKNKINSPESRLWKDICCSFDFDFTIETCFLALLILLSERKFTYLLTSHQTLHSDKIYIRVWLWRTFVDKLVSD